MTTRQLLTRYPHWDYLIRAGVHYGYPACCIHAFVLQNEHHQGWIDREKEVIQAIDPHNHGFVPCVKCARKILAGKATFASLIKNRKCKTAFPVDEYTNCLVTDTELASQ